MAENASHLDERTPTLGVVNSYAHMPFWGLKSFFSSLRDVLRGRHSTSYLAQVCHVFDSGCWLS